MLHFHKKKPTDSFVQQDFTSDSAFKITDNGQEINDTHLIDIIYEMIERQLTINRVCSIDTFPLRHSAAFLTGTNKWREKGGIRREFNARGATRVLLRPPR